MRSRPARIAAIAFGLFVFVGISFMLARSLTGAGVERSRVTDVLRAQARGDAEAVLRLMPACRDEPACASSTRTRIGRLARAGEVQILNFQPSVQMAVTEQVGSARVAWQIKGSRSPVVQCVRIRREGPLGGGATELLAISNPIGRESPCA